MDDLTHIGSKISILPGRSIPPNDLKIAEGKLDGMLDIVAPPFGRSDACVELMEHNARNANSTKRPINRSRDVT